MLLGCCHCGESPPSESVSLSESAQSESLQSDSDGPLSTDPLTCGPCVVVPAKWIVTLSGWTGTNASHNSCCGNMNGEYLLSISSETSTPCTVSITGHCRIWTSAQKALNLGTPLGTPPSCADTSPPRVQLALYTFAGITYHVVSVLYANTGTFGSPTSDCFQRTFTTAPGCFYSGDVPWLQFTGSAPQRRCNRGTVTMRPA